MLSFGGLPRVVFNEFFVAAAGAGDIEVGPGKLHGRVEVRALVTSVSSAPLDATGLQRDYVTSKFALEVGSVIAWSESQSFSVGMDKLAPMESIFKLGRSDTLPDGTFSVTYDDDYIRIFAPERLLTTIHSMRGISKAKAVALNSIYMPALMEVIQGIQGGDDFEGNRWHRVLSAKAEHIGVDLMKDSPLKAAQKLLKGPAARLTDFMEKLQ